LSSRNAIEKFAALFPRLTTLPAQLVSINLKEEEQLANEQYINHKLMDVYTKLTKYSLHGNIEKELLKFLGEESERIMVVMGAFGRSDVSRFFRDSLAKVILEKTRLSLFIVHK
jgi:nucleotide-binding universal stress UspA family protein